MFFGEVSRFEVQDACGYWCLSGFSFGRSGCRQFGRGEAAVADFVEFFPDVYPFGFGDDAHGGWEQDVVFLVEVAGEQVA